MSIALSQVRADRAVRSVLESQWNGDPMVLLDSPPGAGKTGIVERLAVQAIGLMAERCMIATQTNEQAFDLCRRLARGFPRLSFVFFARQGLAIPADVCFLANLNIVHSPRDFPQGPVAVIANAAKWSWIRDDIEPFDLQIVDESYQLPDYRFHQIAGLAHRHVLVGDPGQIAPIITCEIERWRCDPAGPHVACPSALVTRHPDIRRISLPVSRRLPTDTAAFVQPAFYPDLPFTALVNGHERRLGTVPLEGDALDPAIDLACDGATIVSLEIPPLITGIYDTQASSTIIRLIERLLARQATVTDEAGRRPLKPGTIGVVCTHVAQVNAVRERLPDNCAEVLVETADRFQGLERQVMIVHHPLSGRADAGAFHLDAGRLCVMLSRHRVACFVVARGGIEPLLHHYAPGGNRALGMYNDPEFEGWRAHVTLLAHLEKQGRIVRLQHG